MKITSELARAAAQDAGDRNMRKHGRSKWNREDFYVASREYNRLSPLSWELIALTK